MRPPKGPKRPPRGPQEPPKRTPSGPRRPPRSTQDAQEPPLTAKRPPRRPKRLPKGFQEASERHSTIHPASSFSSSLLRSVLLSPSLLPHFPGHLNSPGRRFRMGWWGYAKRQQFHCAGGAPSHAALGHGPVCCLSLPYLVCSLFHVLPCLRK